MQVLVFSKENCPPCKTWKATLEELAADMEFTFEIIDIVQDPARAASYDVAKTPSTFVVHKDETVGSLVGTDARAFLRLLDAGNSRSLTVHDDGLDF